MMRTLLLLLVWAHWTLAQAAPAGARTGAGAAPQQLWGVGNATWRGTPHMVSWQPRAVLFPGFLSAEECEYILRVSRPLMEPAMLVNRKEQRHFRSPNRTSWGAFHDSFGDAVLAMLTHRIAHVLRVPPGNLEPWQVMRYGAGEQYTSHVDYYDRDTRFFGNSITKFGGQRVMTALLYLTSCEGGETVLRKAPTNAVGAASCAGRGAGVPARAGDMLLFHNVLPDGRLDNLTSHLSCPVTAGEKVVVSRFVREGACHLTHTFSKRKWNGNVFCEDDHGRCGEWRAAGLCADGGGDPEMRGVMRGDATWPGFCERSCGVCRPLEPAVVDMRRELGQSIPEGALPAA